MRYPQWADHEDEFVERNHERLSVKEMAEKLGRPEEGVRYHLYKLGLRSGETRARQIRVNFVAGFMDDKRSILMLSGNGSGERTRDFLTSGPRPDTDTDGKISHKMPSRKERQEMRRLVKELCEKSGGRFCMSDYL